MELRQPPQSTAPVPPDRLGRILLLLILILLTALGAWLLWRFRAPASTVGEIERTREVAARLQAAGALDEAAALYAVYLESAEPAAEKRARIAYSLGTNYLQTGRYEQALRWFYEAETLDRGELSTDLAARIVHTLERLGRHHAAQAALESSVELGLKPEEHAAEDPVVARIGQTQIRRSELDRALGDLPPELASAFSAPTARSDFLRKFVADELLWRKARKLEYDSDPEVLRRQELLVKQLTIARFVEQEVVGKIVVDEPDLRNFFEANRQRYQSQQGDESGEEPSLAQVRPQVERDYRLQKIQSAYDALIESELAAQEVELFPERLDE